GGAFGGYAFASKPGMPRSSNWSRQYGSRYGCSALKSGIVGCTSQSMAAPALVTSAPPSKCQSPATFIVIPDGPKGRSGIQFAASAAINVCSGFAESWVPALASLGRDDKGQSQ